MAQLPGLNANSNEVSIQQLFSYWCSTFFLNVDLIQIYAWAKNISVHSTLSSSSSFHPLPFDDNWSDTRKTVWNWRVFPLDCTRSQCGFCQNHKLFPFPYLVLKIVYCRHLTSFFSSEVELTGFSTWPYPFTESTFLYFVKLTLVSRIVFDILISNQSWHWN